MNIQVIHLDKSNWKKYRDIYLEELEHEPNAFLNSFEVIKNYTEEHWSEILSTRSQDIYFANVDNQIVGMAGVTLGTEPKHKHVADLWGVYVKSEYRSSGIATKIIEHIISDLPTRGISKLNLGVVATQEKAYRLYTHLGFRVVGILHKEFYVNGNYNDEILMEMVF